MTIQEYLQQLLDLILLENYEIELEEEDQQVILKIRVPEEDSGILIGRHGETLAAIQKIIRMTFLDQLGDKRLVININDYRDQRQERVRQLVARGVDKIRQSGGEFYLYRLNPAERFFAHQLINDELPDFSSHSINDEDGQRVLVIELKQSSESAEKQES